MEDPESQSSNPAIRGANVDGLGEDGPDKAFQVIVLGGGGGPIEDDVTGLLVRSRGTQWARNSILAVDAGVHLSAIVQLIEKHLPHAVRQDSIKEKDSLPQKKPATPYHRATQSRQGYFSPVIKPQEAEPPPSVSTPLQNDGSKLVMTTGPFKDLLLPSESAKANALYLLRHLISTYLITHPHLDHLSGFTINTAAFQFTTRPKKLAALPHTINAVKMHVFNDLIWPNLSDEEGGAGLVSFQRLTEGGNLSLGDGEGRGYVEVCDGLAVKGWSISHGHCMKQHHHRGSIAQDFSFANPSERRGSRASLPMSPSYRRHSLPHNEFVHPPQPEPCVTDSSAFFILDEHTRKEILVFGDVEPDSISLSPRTARVWTDAAPKIVAGLLQAIFIECSYDDSQPDETLFGHLSPRHLIAELVALAEKVIDYRAMLSGEKSITDEASRKRKRDPASRVGSMLAQPSSRGRTRSPGGIHQAQSMSHRRTRSSVSPDSRTRGPHNLSRSHHNGSHHLEPISPTQIAPLVDDTSGNHNRDHLPSMPTRMQIDQTADEIPSSMGFAFKTHPVSPITRVPGSAGSKIGRSAEFALQGLKVIIIHVKDTMKDFQDGPPAHEIILDQLRRGAEEAELGVFIEVARKGDVMWL